MQNHIILGYNTKTISVSLVAGQLQYQLVSGNIGIPPRALVVGVTSRAIDATSYDKDGKQQGENIYAATLTLLDKNLKQILTNVPVAELDSLAVPAETQFSNLSGYANDVLIEPLWVDEIDFASSTLTLSQAAATAVTTGQVIELTFLYTDEDAQPVDMNTSTYAAGTTTAGIRCKAVYIPANAIDKTYTLYNKIGLDDTDIVVGFKPVLTPVLQAPSTALTPILNVSTNILYASFLELKTVNGSTPIDNVPFVARYPRSISTPYFPLVPRRVDTYNWLDSRIIIAPNVSASDNTAFIFLIYYVKP